jgi:hypothetical protein
MGSSEEQANFVTPANSDDEMARLPIVRPSRCHGTGFCGLGDVDFLLLISYLLGLLGLQP